MHQPGRQAAVLLLGSWRSSHCPGGAVTSPGPSFARRVGALSYCAGLNGPSNRRKLRPNRGCSRPPRWGVKRRPPPPRARRSPFLFHPLALGPSLFLDLSSAGVHLSLKPPAVSRRRHVLDDFVKLGCDNEQQHDNRGQKKFHLPLRVRVVPPRCRARRQAGGSGRSYSARLPKFGQFQIGNWEGDMGKCLIFQKFKQYQGVGRTPRPARTGFERARRYAGAVSLSATSSDVCAGSPWCAARRSWRSPNESFRARRSGSRAAPRDRRRFPNRRRASS
jgi:hypothetical protein